MIFFNSLFSSFDSAGVIQWLSPVRMDYGCLCSSDPASRLIVFSPPGLQSPSHDLSIYQTQAGLGDTALPTLEQHGATEHPCTINTVSPIENLNIHAFDPQDKIRIIHLMKTHPAEDYLVCGDAVTRHTSLTSGSHQD